MRALWLLLALLASPLAAQQAPVAYDAASAAPLTPGQWSYAATATGSDALFAGRFLIRCDRIARRVTLRRIELGVAAPASPMTITTDLATRPLAADSVVANSDPLLDAIAFTRGRFIVSGGGSALRLIVPASPEAARSIEDCRN